MPFVSFPIRTYTLLGLFIIYIFIFLFIKFLTLFELIQSHTFLALRFSPFPRPLLSIGICLCRGPLLFRLCLRFTRLKANPLKSILFGSSRSTSSGCSQLFLKISKTKAFYQRIILFSRPFFCFIHCFPSIAFCTPCYLPEYIWAFSSKPSLHKFLVSNKI